MKFLGVINGWSDAPECWLEFLARPVWFQRHPTLEIEQGEWVIVEAPVVYGLQVLGVVLFFERAGMTA